MQSSDAESWIANAATRTGDLRSFIINCLVIAGIAICLVVLCQQVFSRATFVEPIDAPGTEQDMAKAVQSSIEMNLYKFENEIASVTPGSSMDRIPSQFDPPDFSMPGTSIQMRTVVKYLKGMLPYRDWTITGQLIKSSNDKLQLHLAVKGPEKKFDKMVDADTASREDTGKGDFQNALLEVLRAQSPYLYASYIAKQEREKCYKSAKACDFESARNAYAQIIVRGKDDPHYQWALLGLSKIEQDQQLYEPAISHARTVAVNYTSGWAYYNWGVSLIDLGCYEAAIQPLLASTQLLPSYEAGYNALGRAYLAIARLTLAIDGSEVKPVLIDTRGATRNADADLHEAQRLFQRAITLKADYQEAHVNLGESLNLLGEADGARTEYETAIALDAEHAGRAYQKMAEISGSVVDRETDFLKARMANTKLPECRYSAGRSLRESMGCIDDANGMAGYSVRVPELHGGFTGISHVALCKKLAVRDGEMPVFDVMAVGAL
ncbi:tetratricopeptide repeat protein [Paraburkholderia sediminicola]|uniref:tetratricopeptide repeat protein n=1 Tax=Paraburkholderia sediminicola TaxID=458836 RepID=UPI0038B97DB1